MEYHLRRNAILVALCILSRVLINSSGEVGDEESLCKNYCYQPSLYENEYRYCQCDQQCAANGDCCMDSEYFDPTASRNIPCSFVRDNDFYYQVDTCQERFSYIGNVDLDERCRYNVPFLEDPFGNVPATSSETNVTYKNFYCAVCNGETFETLNTWDVLVSLSVPENYVSPYNNITENYLRRNLVFLRKRKAWGIWVRYGKHRFLEATLTVVLPDRARNAIRRCIPAVSGCSPYWDDISIQDKCEFQYDPVKSDHGEVYRNKYCAYCNNVPYGSLHCRWPNRDGGGSNREQSSLAILVPLAPKNNPDPYTESCNSGELYDGFRKRCRAPADEVLST